MLSLGYGNDPFFGSEQRQSQMGAGIETEFDHSKSMASPTPSFQVINEDFNGKSRRTPI